MLEGMPPPRLKVYPRATVAAEKLEAIVNLGMANSRMKDFFDLRALAREGVIDSTQLGEAIAATCKRRGTARIGTDGRPARSRGPADASATPGA
jgi:hypothetical protein